MTEDEARKDLEPLFAALVREYRAYMAVMMRHGNGWKPDQQFTFGPLLRRKKKSAKRYERILDNLRNEKGEPK